MSWSTQRPLFNRLPTPYLNSDPAEWFTRPWDVLLMEGKGYADNFYRDFLDPDTADEAVLDWLSQFCGYTGEYWDSTWSASIKRTLIREAYSRVWATKGSRALLEWLINLFNIQASVFIPGEFLADSSVVGDPLGFESGFIYYIRAPIQYARASSSWLTLERLNNLYGPIYAKSRVVYDQFYADYSVAGDPVFDQSLFEDLLEMLSPSFVIPANVAVYRERSHYFTNIIPSDFDFASSAHVTYTIDPAGDDTDSGSPQEPLESIDEALDRLEASVHTRGLIWVNPGVYRNDWRNNRTSKDVCIKAVDSNDRPIFRIDSFQTWTLHSGTTWSARKDSNPPLTHCFDLSQSEKNRLPKMLSSIAAVEATPNSQYLDTDGTLYVNLRDGREPDNDVRPSFAVEVGGLGDDRSAIDGTNLTIYIENLIFEGGELGFTINGTGQDATLVNCTFRYSAGDGFSTLPPGESVETSGTLRLIDCVASDNLGYGFDIQTTASNLDVIVDGSIATRNVRDNLRLSNTSAVVVSGNTLDAINYNLHIEDGTEVWIVGVLARNAGSADVYVESGSSAYLYGVITQGSSAMFGLQAESGAIAVFEDRNEIHSVFLES